MNAIQSPELTVRPSGERDVVMTRVFNAPRRLVFDAWTRPELLVRWFGARGWSLPVCDIDLRPGGTYRYVMRGPDGAEVTLRGTYREVDPPERLVSTEGFEGFSEEGWRPEDETVSSMLLTEQDGKTTWTMTTTYPSREVRDAAYALKQAWEGMRYSFDRLDEVLRTRDLVVTRTFDAPVERVWRAWTESEDVKQWWGPLGFSAPSHRWTSVLLARRWCACAHPTASSSTTPGPMGASIHWSGSNSWWRSRMTPAST